MLCQVTEGTIASRDLREARQVTMFRFAKNLNVQKKKTRANVLTLLQENVEFGRKDRDAVAPIRTLVLSSLLFYLVFELTFCCDKHKLFIFDCYP